MRHAVRGRKLARTNSHRLALRRNLVQSLIEHGEIRTTLIKAKEVRSFAEKLVSLAVDGSLAARQRAEALLRDRAIIAAENQAEYDRMSDAERAKVMRSRSGRRYRAHSTRPGVKFTAATVVNKLFKDIGPKMKRRNEKLNSSGGYTRIIRLPERRLGDGGAVAMLQFVAEDDTPRKSTGDKSERKRRSRVRYSVFAGKPRVQPGERRRGTRSAPAKPAGESAAARPDSAKAE